MDLSWLLPQRNVAKPSARASAVRNVLAEVGVKDSEIEAVVQQTVDGNKRFEALLRAANYDTDDPVLQQLAEASRHAGKNPIMPGMGSNTFRALQGGSWVKTQAEVDAREAAHLVKSARDLAHAQSLMLQSNVMPNPVTMAAAKEKKAAAWNGTSMIRTDRKAETTPAAKNLVTQQTFVASKVKEEPPPAPPAAKMLVPQQTFVAPKVKLSESEGEEALEGFLAEKAAGRMMEGLLNDWAEAAKEEATAAPPQLRRGPPSLADFRLPEAAAVAASALPDPGESNMYLGNQPIAFKPLTPTPGGVEGRSTSQCASRPPAAPAAGGEAAKLEAKLEAAAKAAAEAARQVEKASAAKKAAKTSAELAAASAAEGKAKREVEKAKAEEAKAKKQLDAKLELEGKKQAEVEAKRLEAEREAAAKEAAAKAAAEKAAAEKAAAEKVAAEKVAAEKAAAEKAVAEKAAAEKAVAEKAAAAERAPPEAAAPKVAKEGHSSSPQTVPGRASPQVLGGSPQAGSPPSAPGSGSPPPPSEDFAVWKPPPVSMAPRPPWADKKGSGAAGGGDKKGAVAGDSRAGRAAARRMQRHTDREESRSISPKGLEGAVRGLVPKYCTPIVANPFGSFKPWEETAIPVVNPAIALGPMAHSSAEVQRLQHVGTNIYGNPHHTIPVPTTYGATFVPVAPVAHIGGGASARHDPGPGAEPGAELGADAPKQKSIFGW